MCLTKGSPVQGDILRDCERTSDSGEIGFLTVVGDKDKCIEIEMSSAFNNFFAFWHEKRRKVLKIN